MTRSDFNDIIHNLNRKLFYIAFRILKNKQEAEDAVQEAFMKMWMMGERLDEYKDIGALAITITKNYSIDMLRKWRRIDNAGERSEVQNTGFSPTPYDQMVRAENSEILKKIIEDLPPNFREIIILREIEGMSYEEIAQKSSYNINNLRVTLSRARRLIKEQYIKYSYERGKAERVAGKIL